MNIFNNGHLISTSESAPPSCYRFSEVLHYTGEDAKDLVSHIDDTQIRDLPDPATGQQYAKEGSAAVMATEVSDKYTDSIPGAPVVYRVL